MERLVKDSFFSGDFRPERNASTNNAMDFGSAKGVEVGSRICLACVRSEGTSFFFVGVLNVVAEVIVAGWVIGKMKVIFQWSKIDGCSCEPSLHYYTGHDLGTIMPRKKNIPLFHLPRRRAPRSSLSTSGVALCFKNALNSGTRCKSKRKQRKLPSRVHGGRDVKVGSLGSLGLSPSRPRRIIP
jgi:hypothetical protein